MLKIDDFNNITLTRGDYFATTVVLTSGDQAYVPVEGDEIRFAMSRKYVGEIGYALIREKTIPTDTLLLTLSSEETKVPNGIYNYDVQVTHVNDKPDTVISATFTITGECE